MFGVRERMDATGWEAITGWATIFGVVVAIIVGVISIYAARNAGFIIGPGTRISAGMAAAGAANTPVPADGRGGNGGSGTIVGGHGEILGGPGGAGGIPNSGRGGDGGSGTVVGSGTARIIGGAGGSAAQWDGRGGKAGPGPTEVANGPTNLWKLGRGGSGANAAEYDRRLGVLTTIRRDYLRTFPDQLVFIDAGVEQVPANWVNKRLEELGQVWKVEMDQGGYKMPPLSTQ